MTTPSETARTTAAATGPARNGRPRPQSQKALTGEFNIADRADRVSGEFLAHLRDAIAAGKAHVAAGGTRHCHATMADMEAKYDFTRLGWDRIEDVLVPRGVRVIWVGPDKAYIDIDATLDLVRPRAFAAGQHHLAAAGTARIGAYLRHAGVIRGHFNHRPGTAPNRAVKDHRVLVGRDGARRRRAVWAAAPEELVARLAPDAVRAAAPPEPPAAAAAPEEVPRPAPDASVLDRLHALARTSDDPAAEAFELVYRVVRDELTPAVRAEVLAGLTAMDLANALVAAGRDRGSVAAEMHRAGLDIRGEG